MAKKDTINYGGVSEPAVNIHFSVGTGGDNGAADVMLIQTLFHYLSHIKGMVMRNLGIALGELPSITGICDLKTQRAILRFQRHNASKLLSVDGLIHPAKYEGRMIRGGEKRVMSITLLHFYAQEMQMYQPEPNYFEGLINMVPQLRPWLT